MKILATSLGKLLKRLPLTAHAMIALGLLATVGVAGSLYQRDLRMKQSLRQIANQELLAHHWKKLEAFADFASVIDELHRHFSGMADGSHPGWESRWVPLQVSAAALDPFETDSLVRIQGGAGEVWDGGLWGVRRYARGIRSVERCFVCHPTTREGTQMQVGDLIGIQFLYPSDGSARPDLASSLAHNGN